jgi:hypothetical protein
MPCDYSKYPPNWKTEIRPAILKRESNRCKWCGIQNSVYRHKYGETWQPSIAEEERPQEWSKIVLTVAHVHDHDPMNCDPENLAALCQRCHNRHDARRRAENRRAKQLEGDLALMDLVVATEKVLAWTL